MSTEARRTADGIGSVGPVAGAGGLSLETNGINVIGDAERKGTPRQLFWPWFASNISVLGIAYGAYTLSFGVSVGQAVVAGVIGVVFSFLVCGFVALAGKRGSAPTMVLSRAAFGVRGNRVPSAISWLLLVGWETILVTTATLATATVFSQLGWGGGPATLAVALVVVAGLVIFAGVLGFDIIMRLMSTITVLTAALTVVYLILIAPVIDFSALAGVESGSTGAVIGALVFLMTGFGLGWANLAADYSRYLPRSSSSVGVVGWTAFGGAIAPIVLLTFGLLLAGSSPELSESVGNDPVGALAASLPVWFLVPFVLVAVLGLVGGATLDVYSSGLALLATGVRLPRWAAVLIDGLIMVLGTVYIVFVAGNFFTQFQGFLITLGVPIASWIGIFLADVALRRRDYDEADLYRPTGRYGDVNWAAVTTILGATVLGWGLVTNSEAEWLQWQGYLLGPLGLGGRDGDWAFANIGVLLALVLSFVATLLLSNRRVRAQESRLT